MGAFGAEYDGGIPSPIAGAELESPLGAAGRVVLPGAVTGLLGYAVIELDPPAPMACNPK
jgi:hypothetical protein